MNKWTDDGLDIINQLLRRLNVLDSIPDFCFDVYEYYFKVLEC